MPRSQLEAMLTGRCPRCREGKLFIYPSWNLRHFDEMHKFCPHCGQRLEPEPGFYFGAMYMSHAFSTGIMIATLIVLYYFFGDPSATAYVLTAVGMLLLSFPFMFRTSRIWYLHLFSGIKFEENPVRKQYADSPK